ncbi:MAG: DPP IV N-terminal domain-containing protein, partial [Gemmatimonadota bacterium]|nr:DPP IV N-terminal domain-containing protein [Gemmatimonadota bacterium]
MSYPTQAPRAEVVRVRAVVATALFAALTAASPALAQTVDYSRAERFLTWNTERLIAGARVAPNWLETGDTDRFWYRNNTGSGYEFVLVNPAAGSRERLFDHYRLAGAMSLANDTSYVPGKLPFSTFDFGDTESEIEFAASGRRFVCDIVQYACIVTDTLPSRVPYVESPDGRWEAFAHEYNLYVRPAEGGDSVQLTTDGEKYYAYGYNEPGPNQLRQGVRP